MLSNIKSLETLRTIFLHIHRIHFLKLINYNKSIQSKLSVDLNSYKEFLYPYWLKYIGLNEEQINERIKKDQFNINILTSKVDDNISNLNIKEFINYCKKIYLNYNKNEQGVGHASNKKI